MNEIELDPEMFFSDAIQALIRAGVPFLVGGAYALERYVGYLRRTRDLDLFVQPEDGNRALAALAAAGYRVEVTDPRWLGKARFGEYYVDVIFNSPNLVAEVDSDWFAYAVHDEVLGLPVRLCPPEEIVWTKAYVMERERYDGADVAHMLHAVGHELDWARLIRRFGDHFRLLLAHVLMFEFIYPGERSQLPEWAIRELIRRLDESGVEPPAQAPICRGTLLSDKQYAVDVERWGYLDARRLAPPPTLMIFSTEPQAAGQKR